VSRPFLREIKLTHSLRPGGEMFPQ